MRKIWVLACLLLFVACKKIVLNEPARQTPKATNIYNVEDFRKPGMTDYETLKAACDNIPNNSVLQFDRKVYLIDHTIYLYSYIDFYGPATLQRENQVTYTLKEPANTSTTTIILNNTEGLSKNDGILASFGQSDNDNPAINAIKEVHGDTVVLAGPLGATNAGITNYPAGTKLFKNINFFEIVDNNFGPTNQGCSFQFLTFDGNRENNTGSYSWRLNAAIVALVRGKTKYKDCTFVNSPGETIVSHNVEIRNCIFSNLNGSAFHTSSDKVFNSESDIHSYLSGNVFENTNQVPNAIGGHSEGAITHSNSGGYYTAENNTFANVGECVLGGLYPSLSAHDWGTSNITFTNNTISGALRMVRFISLLPGTIHDVRIEKNKISNMPSFDYSVGLDHWKPEIILKDIDGE